MEYSAGYGVLTSKEAYKNRRELFLWVLLNFEGITSLSLSLTVVLPSPNLTPIHRSLKFVLNCV